MPLCCGDSFSLSVDNTAIISGMNERVTTAGVAVRDGRVLVAHRTQGGALSGKWEFPGGKQRWGESDDDTLRREYMEELGVSVRTGELLLSFDFTNNDTLYHLHAHLVELESCAFTLNVHSEIRWVGPDELNLLDMGQSDQRIREIVTSLLLNS